MSARYAQATNVDNFRLSKMHVPVQTIPPPTVQNYCLRYSIRLWHALHGLMLNHVDCHGSFRTTKKVYRGARPRAERKHTSIYVYSATKQATTHPHDEEHTNFTYYEVYARVCRKRATRSLPVCPFTEGPTNATIRYAPPDKQEGVKILLP